MIEVLVRLIPRHVAELEDIAFSGSASNGFRQDFQFCLTKAISEFIKKYEEK